VIVIGSMTFTAIVTVQNNLMIVTVIVTLIVIVYVMI